MKQNMVRKLGFCAAVCVCMLFLNGCGYAKDIEEQAFPLALGIDATENGYSFTFGVPSLSDETKQNKTEEKPSVVTVEALQIYDAALQYEAQSNKQLDFNHLKVIVFGEGMRRAKKQYETLIMNLLEDRNFAGNIYVMEAEKDAAAILASENFEGGSMGEYLQGMMESLKKEQRQAVTLKDWEKYWMEGKECKLFPIVGGEEKPVLQGFSIWKDKEFAGMLTKEEAKLVSFAQGGKLPGGITLDNGSVFFIDKNKVQTLFQNENDKPVAEISIRIQGMMKNRIVVTQQNEQELEQEIKTKLFDKIVPFFTAWKEQGIDLLNTYPMLPSYDRKLYRTYRDAYERYGKDLRLTLKLEVDI